jgi:diadenosine tetraphosphate (Ap4A) HIT family hydrolase
MAEISCPFCFPDANRIFHAGELVLGLWDGYPVSPGHALLVPRRHVASWFDATSAERGELAAALEIARTTILRGHRPDGFNIGINVGAAAGQTMFHLHVHVIPRYAGDVPDPRGGVRHVLPCKQPHVAATGSEPIIHDASAPWLSTLAERRDLSSHKEDEEPGIEAIPSRAAARSDAAAFGERILLLLDKGRFTTTYKYAVLLALIDLCLEQGSAFGGASSFTTQQLAQKVVELYWPQTAPYPGQKGLHVLAQHHGGQAEIVSAIQKFRERSAVDPSQPLSGARVQAPNQYSRLVKLVEWKLVEMPLPRLQVIGEGQDRFLYNIAWNDAVRRQDLEDGRFDNRIHLLEGVAEQLVQLSGLLRPLIQRSWAGMVAGMNRDTTDEARLQEFLFGAQRISLEPVRQNLRELQNNRCFYCDGRTTGAADVDHFIPWARHP